MAPLSELSAVPTGRENRIDHRLVDGMKTGLLMVSSSSGELTRSRILRDAATALLFRRCSALGAIVVNDADFQIFIH